MIQPYQIGSLQTSFTMEELKSHRKGNDCWLMLDDDEIFDITTFVPVHPSGTIIGQCGEDALEMFWGCSREV